MNAKWYHTLANLTPLAVILGALSAFAAQDVREEFHQNYPLNKDGKIFLENVNGNVHVVTWDRDEVKLDAVKHAKKQEQLDEVKIEVDAKADSIRIKTKYPDSRKSRNNSARKIMLSCPGVASLRTPQMRMWLSMQTALMWLPRACRAL